MQIYLNFDLIHNNDKQSLRMLNFANSTVKYKNWFWLIYVKFDVEKCG